MQIPNQTTLQQRRISILPAREMRVKISLRESDFPAQSRAFFVWSLASLPNHSWSFSPLSLVTAGLFFVIAIPRLAADEPLPTNDEPSRPKSTAKPATPAVDDKLIQALDSVASEPAGSEIVRLERAIQRMREANRRIEADDTSSATLELQRGVIEDLEKLLDRLKKNQSLNRQMQKNPDPSTDKPQGKQPLSKPQLNPQNSRKSQSSNEAEPGNRSQRNDDQKSRDAEDRLEATKAARADESRRQQLIKDVWGHLPPHLRDAMRNTFSEKYLPKYEDLVKRYYEALAEKNRTRTEKQPARNR
jgi:hypothetical protein